MKTKCYKLTSTNLQKMDFSQLVTQILVGSKYQDGYRAVIETPHEIHRRTYPWSRLSKDICCDVFLPCHYAQRYQKSTEQYKEENTSHQICDHKDVDIFCLWLLEHNPFSQESRE
ncbi:hypothetical protein PR048_012519 [Dryococelus australis]|uniref:Uncharacterized protein n=1 Tax=Dryococelus australis TaxID=614101 RepID=A0ABQ9HPM1_9NEOP|nr:hypothetical protein PR048_012519 [Dryococelus australis]